MNTYELSQDDREKKEQSYRESFKNLNEQYQKYTQSILEWSGQISYLEKPITIENLWFFTSQDLTGDFSWVYGEQTGSYLHVANITMSDTAVARLISVQLYGFMMNPATVYFIEWNGQYYFIPSISYGISQSGSGETDTIEQIALVQKQLVRDDIHLFDEKHFVGIISPNFSIPKKISLSQNNHTYTLNFVKREKVLFSEKNLRKLDNLSIQIGKSVYIEKSGTKEWLSPKSQDISKIWSNYEDGQKQWDALSKDSQDRYNQEREQMWIFSSDAIFVEMPDHSLALYALEVPFVSIDSQNGGNLVSIKKNDGKEVILKDFGYQDWNSCGTKDGTFFNIPDWKFRFEEMYILNKKRRDNPKIWKDKLPRDITKSETTFTYQESDLTKIGTTGSWEVLLSFRDKNHPFLRAMYDYGYMNQFDWHGCMDDGESTCRRPISYEAYIEAIPIFFWRDPLGRLIMFVSYSTIMPSACAAKPVIYLYPERTTDISVALDWEKRSLTSIPNYGNGWQVTATPQGNITSGWKNYPYLFWEDMIRYPKPITGFVVKQENLSSFLDQKLSFLGLNSQEIEDFKNYWLPVMNNSQYYRINFITNEQMDKSAPITILPKPDSIQRVFMDWSWLSRTVSIPEQQLVPFSRTGFSVVEWWGKRD